MASDTTNISIRMEKALKNQAEGILLEMGMNLTTAINVYFRQIVRDRSIPFRIALDRRIDGDARDLSARKDFGGIVESIQSDSLRNGTDKLTQNDIE